MTTPEAIEKAIATLENNGDQEAADKLKLLLDAEFEFLSLFDDE